MLFYALGPSVESLDVRSTWHAVPLPHFGALFHGFPGPQELDGENMSKLNPIIGWLIG